MPSCLPPCAQPENLCQKTPSANVTINERVRMPDTAGKVARAWSVTPRATGNRNQHASLQRSHVFVGVLKVKGQPKKIPVL